MSAGAIGERKRIVTGVRPTGPLHLGHYAVALENWVKLQREFDCHMRSLMPEEGISWMVGSKKRRGIITNEHS